MNKGRIVQVMGPVIDVEFENGDLPMIKDALEVMNGNKKCVMEVAQHMGNNIVRCIMLASSEGLHKDMEVTATGSGIKVPVGPKTLGFDPAHQVPDLFFLCLWFHNDDHNGFLLSTIGPRSPTGLKKSLR